MSENYLPQIESDYSKISNMLFKSYLPKIINAAVEFSLFEILFQKDMDITEIGKVTDTDSHVMEALCEILVEIELLDKREMKYGTNLLSEEFLLKKSKVNQLNDIASYSGSLGPFDNLSNLLRNGPPEFDYKMWATKESAFEIEECSKAGSLQSVINFLKKDPDFSSCRKMCDLAGNTGYYSYAVTKENQGIYCEVYDLPEIINVANEVKKKNDRVSFHNFNILKDENFGSGYDLFFVSHFLYGHGADNSLSDFLKKVNKSMLTGGTFVSNHLASNVIGESLLAVKILELITRSMGYKTHQLPLQILEKSLLESGFDQFKIEGPNLSIAIPTTILSAKKVKEVE